MVNKQRIGQLTIWFNSFIPFSVPWDPNFDKVLFKVPRGPHLGKTYVKGPDMTDVRAFIQSLTGALRVFPELGNNRLFDATLSRDRMLFKMHLDAQLHLGVGNVAGNAISNASLRNVTAIGGNAVKLNRETWFVDKTATADDSGLNINLFIASPSTQRPAPKTLDPALSASGRGRGFENSEVAIVNVAMKCGNPLLDMVSGLAKYLGPMKLEGTMWINPIERRLIHNIEIAAFPAYEGYAQIEGGRTVTLFQDQVPTGNTPFDLKPFLGKPMRHAQNYGVEINL